MSAAERGVKEAEAASATVLGRRGSSKGGGVFGAGGGGGDDDSGEDDDGMRLRPPPVLSSSVSSVKEKDLRALESVANTAKTAGSTLPKVKRAQLVAIDLTHAMYWLPPAD